MSLLQDALITKAKRGSAKAVETLSKMVGKDAVLFKRITSLLFKHIQQAPPSLQEQAMVEGDAPSLASVELSIHCIDALHKGFMDISKKALTARTASMELQRAEAIQSLLAQWPAIQQWIIFFVGCLDLHRQATNVSREEQSLWTVMLRGSTGLLASFALLTSVEGTEEMLTRQTPGYLGLVVRLTILPSQSLMTQEIWRIATISLIEFHHVAHCVEEEFVDAMVECHRSPGAMQLFRDRITLGLLAREIPPSLEGSSELMGYIVILFSLCTFDSSRAYPVRRWFSHSGMVPVVARAMARAQHSSDAFSIQFIYQCAAYLFRTIKEERYHFTLEALKGSSGVMSSISLASELLFQVHDRDPSTSIKVAKMYVSILELISSSLIHPAVMRRCARRLQRHPLLLETKDPRFQSLVEASKVLVKAVDYWKSKRQTYKKDDYALCGNVQCPGPGVKPTSLKFCVGCLTTAYCSPECQKSDWKIHQTQCNEQALKYPSRRENKSSLPLYLHYLHWNMATDADTLLAPSDDPAPFVGRVIEVDYMTHPVRVSKIPVPQFFARPLYFEKEDLRIRAIITERQGTDTFIYGTIPNGQFYSFPLLFVAPRELSELRKY
ncbi:hypothetical protein C8J56DRAFT_931776 [Mycena floridula]|nr:hypothetical protein C8J56DRAFT_931776 [Mycena floridula]